MTTLPMLHRCTTSNIVSFLVAVSLLGGCDGGDHEKASSAGIGQALAVAKATNCAQGDHPETALQGQVPASMRATGFRGFNCNLELIGKYSGEGGGWSSAAFNDRAGHACAYYATALDRNIMNGQPIERLHPGVAVVDITNPARPVRTASLTTKAMIDPWESLRVNPRRQVLVGDAGANGAGGPEIELYDLSGDCRYPQLLASVPYGTGKDGGLTLSKSPMGHEGNFAPDGLTYYVGDTVQGKYYAVDITDMTKPRLLSQFDSKTAPLARLSSKTSVEGTVPGLTNVIIGTAHGLSVSDDGNRAYFVSVGYNTPDELADPRYRSANGFYIVDTSEVQARKPNAQMNLISATMVRDGTMAQHTIAVTISGKPYLVFVDEGGAVLSSDMAGSDQYLADMRAACEAGRSPFPMPRIFDISDEKHPKEVSKLMLETHFPANCAKVLPDLIGLSYFTYGSHYCSVDNRQNATALACGYFNSGIRVFDIRNPSHPKEIAYYNPPGLSTKQPGSHHTMLGQWHPGAPDWCASRLDFDFERRTLTTMCMDNGLLVMKFADGVWPMPESTPTVEQTN